MLKIKNFEVMDNPPTFTTRCNQKHMALNKMCDNRFEFSSVIRGHHFYKDIFMPTIRKILQSRREPDNSYDSFAIAIIENDTVVGHVPRNISVLCDLFLKKGGTISCVIIGPRQYLRDLEKGGL